MKVTNSQKVKKNKFIENKNVLETINSIGTQTVDTIKNEAKATSEEFFRQLLGEQRKLQQKKSTELPLGQTLNMNEFVSGETEKRDELEKQLFFERRLFSEEKQESQKKIQELRVRLQAIQTEASRLVASTVNLSENVKVAVMQGSSSASEYQIGFFESIIQMVVSFRKKIDSAVVWLQNSNKRAQKKNYWSQYKKKGASFLLSGESYSQRSAG
jgi:hypothetical protein